MEKEKETSTSVLMRRAFKKINPGVSLKKWSKQLATSEQDYSEVARKWRTNKGLK